APGRRRRRAPGDGAWGRRWRRGCSARRAPGTPRRPRRARLRATGRAARARWRSDPLDLPFSHERDGAAERGLASFELPREAPDDEALVLELGRVDLPSQILDVDAVLAKQRVVRELLAGVGEHLLHRGFAADFLLRLAAHLVAFAVGAFPQR